ncbi:MAG TPA: hypothetical protein VH041_10780, partial [Caldimonas sp.]
VAQPCSSADNATATKQLDTETTRRMSSVGDAGPMRARRPSTPSAVLGPRRSATTGVRMLPVLGLTS